MIDTPWPERGGVGWGNVKRGADRHYPVIPVKRSPEVTMGSGVYHPAPSAHLYLWTTGTYLMAAGWVMQEIGFTYKTCVPWVKTDQLAGLGQYFRTKAEYLLFGVRGSGYEVRTDDRYVVGLIEAARRRHSEKPEATYELIERRSHGPYLEMFSRLDQPRPGGAHWGNEAPA